MKYDNLPENGSERRNPFVFRKLGTVATNPEKYFSKQVVEGRIILFAVSTWCNFYLRASKNIKEQYG